MKYFDTDTVILVLLFILFLMSIIYVLIYTEKNREDWRDTVLEYRNGKLMEVEK